MSIFDNSSEGRTARLRAKAPGAARRPVRKWPAREL